MYKYKLVQKVNPQQKDAPRKWYATSIGEKAETVNAMTRAATENTTTAPNEMKGAFDLFANYARQQLQQGHIVRVGEIGTLRISIQSEGAEDINDFSASMIKNPKIVFTPSKEFRESVLQGLQFQNAGVLEDGVSYASLTDYRTAKGLSAGQPGTTPGGSGSDGGGEDPMG